MVTAADKAQIHFNALLVSRGDTPGPNQEDPIPVLAWEQNNITFSLYDPYITDDGGGIGFTVEAYDINGPLPLDNPYQFFNPPILLVTGEHTEQVQTGVDGDGIPIYETVYVRDTVESPEEVLQKILYEAVVGRATQLGWEP